MTYSEECDKLQAKVDNVSYYAEDGYSTYLLLKLIATILIAIFRRMGNIN